MNFFLVVAALCASAFASGWTMGLLVTSVLNRIVDLRSARMAFVLGVAPLALGMAAMVAFVAPAFLIYEPRATREVPGVVLLVIGGLGIGLLTRTVIRLMRMMMASGRVIREWRRHAEPIPSIGMMPAMSVDVGHPVVAVAGLTRSALYIDRRVLNACSGDEIEAIAAHELGHVRSGDNAKRLLLAATRGLGHPLVTAWRDAAELDADRFAASDERRGLALASALVKVARAATSPRLDALVASGVHDGGSIDNRVRALLSGGWTAQPPRGLFAKPIVIALTALPLAWKPVHEVVELVVNYLP